MRALQTPLSRKGVSIQKHLRGSICLRDRSDRSHQSDQSCRSDRRKRPLAVGRIVAPSRRGKAPNDCGVRSHTKQATSPVWEVGLGRYPLSSPTHKGSIFHLVYLTIGRSGLCPFDRRLRCVGPLARSHLSERSERSESCIKSYSVVDLTGTDARLVRPLYQGYSIVVLTGRTHDRASLHIVTREICGL